MRRAPSQIRRGFTLLEVLATLVLIGIVIPVAMNGVSLSLNTASSARNKAQAASLAEAKLNEIILMGDTGMLGTSGDFGVDFPGFRWMSESVTRDYDVTEVALVIYWTERGQEQSLLVSTMTYAGTAQSTQGVIP
jgi:prepilin-type N-terminal cleavage/methylation domain-containing protein